MRNYGSQVRLARFHNIFGPYGTWGGGREKAPATLCRKVAEAVDGGTIEVWGDGNQTRSFLYIDDCLEGVRRLMDSDFTGPVNIGSEEMVTINSLAQMIMDIAGKQLRMRHVSGHQGIRGRNSDNRLLGRNSAGCLPARCVKDWNRHTGGSKPKYTARNSRQPLLRRSESTSTEENNEPPYSLRKRCWSILTYSASDRQYSMGD
jgi:nucleoside-diphosphate-sugar epimerase